MDSANKIASLLSGLRVAALESRRAVEMRAMIESRGGVAIVVPAIRELPLEEIRGAAASAEALERGEIDILVFMTGTGTRALLDAWSVVLPEERLQAALAKANVIARGPKPTAALEASGITPSVIVAEPATWRHTLRAIDTLGDVNGRRILVQETSEPNRLFLAELSERGASVTAVPAYRSALPTDLGPLRALVGALVQGTVDVIIFTNAAQVEHLMAAARSDGRAQSLRRALHRVAIASVGPSCSDAIRSYGWHVDIEPIHPSMPALMEETALRALGVSRQKRAVVEVPRPAPVATRPGDPLHESLFLKACRRETTERTPVWLMRQAGRYMKEYRELRAKVPFLELCKNSDLAAEVTVDAAHRLGVDAAIIFSDLLLLVEPLGFDLAYGKDQGPQILNPLRTVADLERIRPVDAEGAMNYVLQAIRKTRRALKPNIPLIGFAGAPFTMASYLIEGRGSRNFVETKKLMYGEPQAWHAFLDKITTATIDYVTAQAAAGAQAIQIFDSWVGALSPEDYRSYVLPHSRRLIANVAPGAPVIHFGTGTTGLLGLLKEAGGNVIGIDWRVELDEAWAQLGEVSVMGNLDPVVLLSDAENVRRNVRRILNQAAGRPGHIFNLGHGILPETPIENVLALIDAVKTGR